MKFLLYSLLSLMIAPSAYGYWNFLPDYSNYSYSVPAFNYPSAQDCSFETTREVLMRDRATAENVRECNRLKTELEQEQLNDPNRYSVGFQGHVYECKIVLNSYIGEYSVSLVKSTTRSVCR